MIITTGEQLKKAMNKMLAEYPNTQADLELLHSIVKEAIQNNQLETNDQQWKLLASIEQSRQVAINLDKHGGKYLVGAFVQRLHVQLATLIDESEENGLDELGISMIIDGWLVRVLNWEI